MRGSIDGSICRCRKAAVLLYGCWRLRAAFLLSLIQADCLLSKVLDRSLDGAQMTRLQLQLQLAAGSAARSRLLVR
jgi:hypothetical protein